MARRSTKLAPLPSLKNLVKRDERLFAMDVAIEVTNDWGEKIWRRTRVRIDGRDGAYRVDMLDGGYLWCSIDGGKGFDAISAAKKLLRRFFQAVQAHGTMCPPQASYLA